MFEFKAYVLCEIRQYCVCNPRVVVCIHIDDIIQETQGKTEEFALEAITGSAFELADRFHAMGLVLSDPKLRTIGSSESLVRRAAGMLRTLAGAVRKAIKYLGCDFMLAPWWVPGQPGPTSVRHERLVEVRSQFRRLLCLQRGEGVGVFTSTQPPLFGNYFKSLAFDSVASFNAQPDVDISSVHASCPIGPCVFRRGGF